jgi:hypothetical protein
MLQRTNSIHRSETGAVMVEAALVMIPLLFFLMLAPTMLFIWAREQEARTEAHRDMFDKTTIPILLLPEAPYGTYGGGITSGQLGTIPVAYPRRLHAYPEFPPEVPDGAVDKPDGLDVTIGGVIHDIFPDGFPNQYVEGWQKRVVKPRGGWFAGEIELKRYGAVIRSPWTWMGWPFIPTQDIIWEPGQIQGWYDDNTIDEDIRGFLQLME